MESHVFAQAFVAFHSIDLDRLDTMAVHITIAEALTEAAEEISVFHRLFRFPQSLTHYSSGVVLRRHSHNRNVQDYGNWSGSVLMYALLYHRGLIDIFDQTRERAEVYSYWGPERQHSGAGQDNARTNLLEAILGVMLDVSHELCSRGARTQRAWYLMYVYACRYRFNDR